MLFKIRKDEQRSKNESPKARCLQVEDRFARGILWKLHSIKVGILE